MKSLHAAALAIVAWYLMIPPIGADNKSMSLRRC